MTRMQDLFATQRRGAQRLGSTLDDAATSRRLEALFDGSPRATASHIESGDEVSALTALITSRRVIEPAPRTVKKPGRLRRSRSNRDWLSIGAACLAIVSLVTASTLVGISVASASPASEAISTLAANEAVLANDIERVNESIDNLEQWRQTVDSDAEALAGPLAALAPIAQIPTVAAAETARQVLLSEIERVDVPNAVAAYRRPPIDPDSLESVGTAIDFVNTRTLEVETTASELDDLRRSLAQTVRPLDDALAALGRELPTVAETLTSANDLASETLQANVTTLASRISDVDTHAAPSAVNDFVSAVTLLRRDHEAREAAIAQQAAAEAEERRRQEQLQREREWLQQQQEQQQEQPPAPVEPPTQPPAEDEPVQESPPIEETPVPGA